MSVTLDIPDRLAELLRTLATERGISIEELGQQALAMGLTRLASAVDEGQQAYRQHHRSKHGVA